MRKIIALIALCLCAASLAGCPLTREEPPQPAGYRILGFTGLGDTAIAVCLSAWETPVPPAPDSGPWPRIRFALLDRIGGAIRPLDSLPASAAPTFPWWYYACERGRPVSVHPAGFLGPQGACSDTAAPVVSPNLYSVAYADSHATVHLLGRELEEVSHLATGADGVEVLEIRSGIGMVSILERRGGSSLWRGFSNDDPSGSDSAWLADPVRVRVQGEGTRLVCGEAETRAAPYACWRPDAIDDIRRMLAEAGSRGALLPVPPEYRPAGGTLAYLEPPARFVFADVATGNRRSFDAARLLAGFRP